MEKKDMNLSFVAVWKQPMVMINPEKLIVKAPDINSLISYVEAVKTEIGKKYSKF